MDIKSCKYIKTQQWRYLTGSYFMIAMVLFSSGVFANNALLFNENSITLQRGDNYKVGDNEQRVWTFEHLSVWKWGDVFFFYDDLHQEGSHQSSYYYELAPRLSLSSLMGRSYSVGPIKDVFLTGTLERGSDGFDGWLLGGSVDWDVPGVAFLSTSIYYRDTDDVAGETWQTTIVWNIPFSVKNLDFVLDGFADIRGNEGKSKGDVSINPQLKLDVGKIFGYSKVLYGGIEYNHWSNKFGIDGVDERNVSALLQVKFSL